MNNIYVLKSLDKFLYDCHETIVVVAENNQDARNFASEIETHIQAINVWLDPKLSKIKNIGVANNTEPKGVVTAVLESTI